MNTTNDIRAGLRQVTKEEFFRVIYQQNLNVYPHPRDVKYAHPDAGSDWTFPNRTLFGRDVMRGSSPHYKPETDYFLADGWK